MAVPIRAHSALGTRYKTQSRSSLDGARRLELEKGGGAVYVVGSLRSATCTPLSVVGAHGFLSQLHRFHMNFQ